MNLLSLSSLYRLFTPRLQVICVSLSLLSCAIGCEEELEVAPDEQRSVNDEEETKEEESSEPSGSTKTNCGRGQYGVNCAPCPAGFSCLGGNTKNQACEPGQYCPKGTSIPQDCPEGSYCEMPGGEPVKCEGGEYCPAGSIEASQCEAGKYCPAGDGSPVTCAAGKYCAPGSAEPTPCGAGAYCPEGTQEEKECEPGYYCPAASEEPVLCSAGDYCPAASSAPQTCSADDLFDDDEDPATPCELLLSGLSISSGVLSPPFAPGTTSYTVQLPLWIESLELNVDFAASIAASLGDTTLTSGSAQKVALDQGENVFTIEATKDDLEVSYSITITRNALSSDYLKASNTGENDDFGWNFALSGDGNTLAVGAFREDSASATDQSDDTAIDSGAVYVFSRTDGQWLQTAYLKASNAEAEDYFGQSVSLSDDGKTLAIGASGEDSLSPTDQENNSSDRSGAAYIFTRTDDVWSQQAYLKASTIGYSDSFGGDVVLSADGQTLAISATSEDSGSSSDQDDNSIPYSGAVYVFDRNGESWSQEAYLKASNIKEESFFGNALSLSADGRTLAVGAFHENSNSASDQSNTGADESGAAYVFARGDTGWSQKAYLKASNIDAEDEFGLSLALSADGQTLAVGAPNERSSSNNQFNNSSVFAGAAYVFERSGDDWSQKAYLKPSEIESGTSFGSSVSLSADGTTLAIGARYDDSARTNAGAAYVWRFIDDSWSQSSLLLASTTSKDGFFGSWISLSANGETVAVGAPGESSDSTGVNGDEENSGADDSGAVYVF